ncbi:response regulator [Phyllobacterium phragmitis]|uniref:response regulator n=1 Tax=Phyllobacterium phragmitis TaxID=2670329 RepID=UPI0013048002|nr:response regulator [Phyllobacterium phragmitis]
MTERHIFLTGASGYLGRNLIRHFTNAGHQVTGLARSDQSAELIAGLEANVVRGDLLRDDLSSLMVGATELVHAAANLDHGPGRDAYEENARGTEAVIAAASDAGIRRLVHISSDSVLQDGRPLRNVDEYHPVPGRPAGAYSAGKAEAERFKGLKVHASNSGRNAISMASSAAPDIVLMDAMMPGMDGFDTCKILKAARGFEDLPIIFMTGYNENEHVVKALAAGGVDFVSKPIRLDQLFARMRVHLSNARRARSARYALDSTGRWMVACDANGLIAWSTPQASDLLMKVGIRSDNNSYLPLDILSWLSESPMSDLGGNAKVFHYSRLGYDIEFRRLSDCRNDEILLRLIDRHRGADEEQLAHAFGLTLREAEVLLWVAHGKSNKEIADILEMSPRTVNKHMEQIFNKLAVEKRTSAATLAVRVLWRE